jgi:hypothetical protein
MKKVALAMFVPMLLLIACKGSEKKSSEATPAAQVTVSKPGSCDERKDTGLCNEYKDSAAKEYCLQGGHLWIDGACPKQSSLGRCADAMDGSVGIYYVNDAFATKDDAKLACTNRQGQWLD